MEKNNKLNIVDNQQIDIKSHFITNIQELKYSFDNKEKHQKYDYLVDFLGCNVDFFRNLRSKQRIIFGEQLGSWLYTVYKQRAALLYNIIEEIGFDKELSGIYTLYRDRYTTNGQKKVFQIIQLSNLLSPVRFISKKFEENNKGKIYSKIEIDTIKEKMNSLFDSVLYILSLSTSDNIDIFKKRLNKMISVPKNTNKSEIRPADFIDNKVFFNINDNNNLIKFFNTIKDIDIKKVLEDIQIFKTKLDDHKYWHKYWCDINSIYFNQDNDKIKSIDKLFNNFILNIQNVDQLAYNWSNITQNKNDKISLFGIVDNDIYYTVYYDFNAVDDKKFVYYKNNANKEEYKRITWDEIKEKAVNMQTGGPSILLEYILMACAGIYIFTDYQDAYTMCDQDKMISEIHKKFIRIKYPWITFDLSDKVSNCSSIYPGSYSLLGAYHKLYNDKISAIINKFNTNTD